MLGTLPLKRYGALAAAMLFIACAAWRALVAIEHYQLSLTIRDDPSMHELEQVSAIIEAVIAFVLLAHAVALLLLSRRPFVFRWPVALCVGALCALALSGSLLGAPILSVPGFYIAFVVTGGAIISLLLNFSWISLYIGALLGGSLACYGAIPSADALTCLFVVAPCVAYVFLGAGLGRLITRLTRHRHVY